MDEETRQQVLDVMKEVLPQYQQVNRTFTPGEDDSPKGVQEPEDKVAQDAKGGFKDMSHFFREVIAEGSRQGDYNTLQTWRSAYRKTAGYLEEGDMSQGGYLVPEEFRAQLLQTSLESAIVRPRATYIPMASNRVVIPALKDSDHSSNYFGGITIYRTAEGSQYTASNPTFEQVALTLQHLTGLAYVNEDLLQDSPISIGPILRKTFGEAIAFVEDDDFLNGSGSNEALGAFNTSNPSIVSVTKETNQVANTIVYENIVKMWARLYPKCHANAVWVANIDTFPQLATMNLAVGTGGAPVWLPGNGAAGSPNGTLMGRPVLFTEKMQTVGDSGDIGLADFSNYLVGGKAGGNVNVATSIHVRFDYAQTAFRFTMRYDGQPWWRSALTPQYSSDDLSPFVKLDKRD